MDDSSNYHALDLRNVDITKIDVAYVPGSGYVAGLTFLDEINGQTTERLRWRQWDGNGGKEPAGMKHITNEPPDRGDGTIWMFAGLAGSWVDLAGKDNVLARVSGVWQKVGDEKS